MSNSIIFIWGVANFVSLLPSQFFVTGNPAFSNNGSHVASTQIHLSSGFIFSAKCQPVGVSFFSIIFFGIGRSFQLNLISMYFTGIPDFSSSFPRKRCFSLQLPLFFCNNKSGSLSFRQ